MSTEISHHSRFQPGIYLLIDPDVLPVERWAAVLPAVLKQNLSLVQLRVKNRSAEETERMARQLQHWCRDAGRPLLINDELELAIDIGAQGVHLGQSDGSLANARQRLGETAIIGRTCHADLALLDAAAAQGADYASIGALYPSRTKPQAHRASLEVLQRATRRNTVPVCAIGGINPNTMAEVVRCGAALVAVCGAVLRAEDPAEATRHLVRLFADERKHTAV